MKRNPRPIAATLAAAAGLVAAPYSQASNTVTGTCDARPAAGSTLSLCDFTPAANGETIAQATFEVQSSGLVSVHFAGVENNADFLQMTLRIVLPGGPVTDLLSGDGLLEFQGIAGTRYTALIYLLPGESNFGMANLLVTQSAVPLPPSALLLASALLTGWRFSRRRAALAA